MFLQKYDVVSWKSNKYYVAIADEDDIALAPIIMNNDGSDRVLSEFAFIISNSKNLADQIGMKLLGQWDEIANFSGSK